MTASVPKSALPVDPAEASLGKLDSVAGDFQA